MTAAQPPEPDPAPNPDAPQDPSDAPTRPRPRMARWLAASHRWQTLIAAVVTAMAALVAVLLSQSGSGGRDPAPDPTLSSALDPSMGRRTDTVVTTHLTRQYADPATPPSGVAVYFEGTVSGLGPGSTVYAMVRRGDERSNWPSALADVDRGRGTWKALVHVPRPRLPLEMSAGAITSAPPKQERPASSPPTDSPAPPLERLRQDGPDAVGIETSTPFRPVAPPEPGQQPGQPGRPRT
ncbi:hypothetical protein ACIQZO_31730 [Streptomyces sp. NPDC097617]|uniref:hypothetical protein n=1 Tax=Streptomyces sp. NPDC097617 TaxID=3366091 RepID=UPI0038013D71